MPYRAPKQCASPGCGAATKSRYCPTHDWERNETARARDKARANSPGRELYNYAWRKAAKLYLKAHGLCVHCKRQHRTTQATEVDHKTPHKGDKQLFWDVNNWQALCKSCHSRKTRKEQLEDGKR